MKARRLTYNAPQIAFIEECVAEAIPENSVLVKTLYGGISRGTESLVYKGLVPKAEHQNMRCPHQVGSFDFPISYGYASVGKIQKTGGSVTDFKVGDTVFALHPHQDLFIADASFCHKLASGLAPAKAVLSANMETALNAVWDANIEESSSVTIIGAGVVGLLTAYLVKIIHGIIPTIIDLNLEKEKPAGHLSLNFSLPNSSLSSQNYIFNTSASGTGLQNAIDMAAFEAKIIEMSWYGDKPVTLNLGGAFHSKRLQIISSQVGHVSPFKRAILTHSDRMQQAMSYLNDPRLDILLESEIDFEDLPNHLHELFNEKSDALCQVVKYKST